MSDIDCSTCAKGPQNCGASHCNYAQEQAGCYPGWTPKPETTQPEQTAQEQN